MTPFHTEPRFTLYVGNSLDVLPTLPPSSVDSIVSDPPYGLSFMGKEWDHGVPGVAFWSEALRVAKPGAHLLAFGGTRTYHRLACAIEDAGWEIRDCVMWVYGSGFPKSLDVSKAIDKAAGAERVTKPWLPRERSGVFVDGTETTAVSGNLQCPICMKWKFAPDYCACPRDDGPATDAAREWSGWGTALKPAWEPIIVARKPLVGTVAENVMAHGTGALNVEGCRVPGALEGDPNRFAKTDGGAFNAFTTPPIVRAEGRWPANVIHDGSEEVVGMFPMSKDGIAVNRNRKPDTKNSWMGTRASPVGADIGYGGGGSAARFFYCAKASTEDRDAGGVRNIHPTVKPTDLMRYLVRLVTRRGGVVLDPFMGSGSTGRGALLEGCRFVGIDLSEDYAGIARARIRDAVQADAPLFDAVIATNDEDAL